MWIKFQAKKAMARNRGSSRSKLSIHNEQLTVNFLYKWVAHFPDWAYFSLCNPWWKALPITGMKIPQMDRGRGAVSNLSEYEFGLLVSVFFLSCSYIPINSLLNGIPSMPSRRSHTKSRKGCLECKRRHVKVSGLPKSPRFNATLTCALFTWQAPESLEQPF